MSISLAVIQLVASNILSNSVLVILVQTICILAAGVLLGRVFHGKLQESYLVVIFAAFYAYILSSIFIFVSSVSYILYAIVLLLISIGTLLTSYIFFTSKRIDKHVKILIACIGLIPTYFICSVLGLYISRLLFRV